MRPHILLPALIVAALAAACGGPAAPPAEPGITLPTPLRTGRTTVAVLGTLHEGHLRGGYPLAVVEHVVRAFQPDVVLVEVPPDALDAVVAEVDAAGEEASAATLENPWIRQLPELYSVVIPLRHELGYEIEGISGWTAQALADRDAFYTANPHGPLERGYIVANAAFHAAFLQNNGPANVMWLHGEEYLELSTDATLWLAYYAEEAMGQGGELHVQARHAALIDQALDAHEGERVLVVFDVGARWGLEPTIDVRTDVDRIDTRAFLP